MAALGAIQNIFFQSSFSHEFIKLIFQLPVKFTKKIAWKKWHSNNNISNLYRSKTCNDHLCLHSVHSDTPHTASSKCSKRASLDSRNLSRPPAFRLSLSPPFLRIYSISFSHSNPNTLARERCIKCTWTDQSGGESLLPASASIVRLYFLPWTDSVFHIIFLFSVCAFYTHTHNTHKLFVSR